MLASIIIGIFIYIIVAPVFILIHEVGHAIGLLLTTKGSVARIYLGQRELSDKVTLRIGRIHFYIIKWGYFGFCSFHTEKRMSKFQFVFFMLCGPFTSFIVSIGLVLLLVYNHSNPIVSNIITALIIGNLFQFMVTIIPLKYPSWMKPYNGYQSDGYHILRTLKNYQ